MLATCSHLNEEGKCDLKRTSKGLERCPAVTASGSKVSTIDYTLLTRMACNDKWTRSEE